MLNDFLDFIDEIIIDECFQPICDRIRITFGWSKRVPSAVMKVLAVIGLFPLCVAMVAFGGIWYLLAGLMLLWILGQVTLIAMLVQDEMRDHEFEITKSDSVLDEYRIKGKTDRKFSLVLSFFLLPWVLAGMLTPEFSYIASFYLAGGTANLCDCFFRACTDLPRGKGVFTRMREWFRDFAKQPIPQTT